MAIAKTEAQTELVTAVQFAEARERLRDAVLHTPLVRISSVTDAVAYLKAESLQPIGSFKLRGKRIFKMAPIHHHFELLGWQESKVIARFWIAGLVLALFALTTLKLR